MVLVATSTVVGVIVSIALVATTIAVCLYLYSQRNRVEGAEEEKEEPESPESSKPLE